MDQNGNIKEQLKECLEAKGWKDWDIRQYSDEADFKSLWEIGDSKITGQKIIVGWDDFPGTDDYDVPLEQYITPIEWALAYSFKYNDKDLRIVILDKYERPINDYSKETKEFHKYVLGLMSDWVVCIDNIEKINSEADFFPATRTSSNEMLKIFEEKDREDLIESIKKRITEYTTRHSINNVLGPILLAKATLEPNLYQQLYDNYPIRKKAFCHCLQWHGIGRSRN